jgi:tetratricopeptide (TPR) repeat protein
VDQVGGRQTGRGEGAIKNMGGLSPRSRGSAGESGRFHVSRAIWGFWIFLLFFAATLLPSLQGAGEAKPAPPEGEQKRIVTLKIALAEPFGIGIEGKREVRKLKTTASDVFSRAFGIEFEIIEWDTWKADRSRNTMRSMLDDLKKKVDPGEADVLVGVAGPAGPSDAPTGIADYFTGVILLRLGRPGAAVPIAIHELGHIFGAVDLDEKGTAMNPRDPGSKFDAFSARVISLNRSRAFHAQMFPFPAGFIKEVIAEYEGRAALGRAEPEIHLFLAYLYIQAGDTAAATKACLNVLRTNSELTEIHNLLGNLYLAQRRADEAIAEYRLVLARNPEQPVAHYNLGLAFLQTGNEAGATVEFREAVRQNPNYAEAHASLGQQFLKKGEVDTALDHARTALKIFPDFPEGLCILAEALLLKGDKVLFEEAASSCRMAAALKPGLPEAHSILGVAYGFMGKDVEAEAELLKTLELRPDSLEAHLNLAVLLRKTGREDKAAYHLGRVAEIDPDFAASQEILRGDKIGGLRYMVLSHGFL